MKQSCRYGDGEMARLKPHEDVYRFCAIRGAVHDESAKIVIAVTVIAVLGGNTAPS